MREALVYRFSRSIYRDLRARVIAPDANRRSAIQRRLLQRCEYAIERLALDPRHDARPGLRLFNEVRGFFPVAEQLAVYEVIDAHLREAVEFLQTEEGSDAATVNLMRCRAATRRGKACQRVPLPGMRYCPSHKHLERVPAERAA